MLLLLSVTYFSLQAKVYRVNNNAGTGAKYSSAQTAHDSCSVGDTLYIEGSSISYGTLNISKKINLIGPGYFLGQNPQTQVNLVSAPFGIITCGSGSAGSYITGIEATNLVVQDNNIIIKRNHFIGNSGSSYASIGIQSNRSGILITQNYVTNPFSYTSSFPIGVSSGCSNITITNNYLDITPSSTYSGAPVIYIDPAASAVVVNNVFQGQSNMSLTLNNTTFNNNIVNIPSGTVTGSNNSMFNNLSASANLDTTSGNAHHNQINVSMSSVFIGTGSTDGQWKLKAGSPAIAAGLSGEDCGMFGGSDPYILSGIPTIPAIYFFAAPSSGSATLPVHIKIKSNK